MNETTPLAALLAGELTRWGRPQRDLAAELGVSQQAVSKWVTGRTEMRLSTLGRVIEVLDLDPAEVGHAIAGTL